MNFKVTETERPVPKKEMRGRRRVYMLNEMKLKTGKEYHDVQPEQRRLLSCALHSSARNSGIKIKTQYNFQTRIMTVWRIS